MKMPDFAGFWRLQSSPRGIQIVVYIIKVQHFGVFAVSAPNPGLVGCLGTLH